MKLLTKTIESSLPQLHTQEKLGDNAIAQVKFFCPWNSWTLYATEYDPNEGIFFGLVDGFEKELGYFTLEELSSVVGPFGLKIERDLHFKPTSIGILRKALDSRLLV